MIGQWCFDSKGVWSHVGDEHLQNSLHEARLTLKCGRGGKAETPESRLGREGKALAETTLKNFSWLKTQLANLLRVNISWSVPKNLEPGSSAATGHPVVHPQEFASRLEFVTKGTEAQEPAGWTLDDAGGFPSQRSVLVTSIVSRLVWLAIITNNYLSLLLGVVITNKL